MDDPEPAPALLPDYAEWLERVSATVAAVSYTCRVRLGGGPEAAVAGEAVALRVATGLVARPAVFRHWGLPYSGRIAKLAEAGLADAAAGHAVGRGSWRVFHAALAAVPPEHQETLVATCVEGLGDDDLAAAWGCDPATAGARRAATLAHMKELAVRCGDDRAVVTAGATTSGKDR
jgi:hypothetical protein